MTYEFDNYCEAAQQFAACPRLGIPAFSRGPGESVQPDSILLHALLVGVFLTSNYWQGYHVLSVDW